MNNLRTRDALVGDAFWDAGASKPVIVLVVPIRRDDGLFLGALSAKVNLNGLSDMLREQGGVPDRSRDVYVITEQGRVVISAAGNSADLMKTVLPAATTRELFEREGRSVAHSRAEGREVVAVLRRVPQLRWATVAEMPRAAALREVREETGLAVELLAPLGTVDYWFTEGKYRYHKYVHYFFMLAVGRARGGRRPVGRPPRRRQR